MQTFFKKIWHRDELLQIFLVPLFRDKHKGTNLDEENKNLLLNVSHSI